MEKLINELDEIVQWPKKLSVKNIVIKHLSTKFECDKNILKKK